MGIFRRKNDEAFKIQLERESLDKMNNDYEEFLLPIDQGGDDSSWSLKGKTKAPHTITAEEINKKGNLKMPETNISPANTKAESIPMAPTEEQSTSDFLFNKMVEARNKKLEEVVSQPKTVEKEDTPKPQTEQPKKEPAKPLDINAAIRELKESFGAKSTTAIEPITEVKLPDETLSHEDITPPTPEQAKKAEERRTSLLARCNAYLEDEELGTAKIDTEKYKLESVESILESFENRAAQRANKAFSTTNTPTVPPVPTTAPTVTTTFDFMPKSAQTKSETAQRQDENIADTIVIPNIEEEKPAEPEVKHIFMAPDLPTESKQDEYEDISSTRVLPTVQEKATPEQPNDGTTSIFEAVTQNVLGMNVDQNNTASEQLPQVDEAEMAFDDYETVADRDRINASLKHSKKRLNIRAFLTLLLLVPAILFITPVAASLTANGMMPLYIAELIVCLLGIAANFNIVKGITSLFNGEDDPDLPAALSIIGTTIFATANLVFDGKLLGFSALALITLLISNLAKAGFYSRAIKNFAVISNSEHKKAVAILKNKTATKTIVGNAIEGGALICCGAETTNVHSFLKYTYCSNPVAEKIKKVTIIGLIFSVALALASLFLNGSIAFAFGMFAAVLTITAAPATLLINNLPFKILHNRLKLYDAMLTGYRAADEFDLCNGIAVNCSDLFPEGTIRLVDMKLLSPNPFDQSMLDAAAIAEAIGSPIAGIFKQVSATSSYELKKPEVDSVIYEEKMGISGWVNDRRVFVGNRILMEAHGFNGLPPVELDKKIMRKGYFPVYLASDNVPCALLVVKYNDDEDVGYELRRLCNTGTTVMVHNCDPNISDDMLSDYFTLPEGTIAVMSKQGSDAYSQVVSHTEHCSAGAAYKSNAAGLFAILTASINIKKSISAMTVIYIIGVILGVLGLGVALFTAFSGAIAPLPILAFQAAATFFTCLPPLIKKP